MILVADSGSSKTHWCIIDHPTNTNVVTKGMNPFFVDSEFVHNEMNQTILRDYRDKISKIVFYGSGCSSIDRNDYLKSIFREYFTSCTDILVDHDMLGACIALFNSQSGIACILGTGSNSCVYDGRKIVSNIPALGYIMGDEAGGSYYGKYIVRNYLYKTLPKEMYDYIHDEMKLDKEEVFNSVYKYPLPNRYLAGFATLLSQFHHLEFTQNLIQLGMNEFVQYHVICYPEYKTMPIAAVGSLAFHFQKEFNTALEQYGVSLSHVDKKSNRCNCESNQLEKLLIF